MSAVEDPGAVMKTDHDNSPNNYQKLEEARNIFIEGP